MLGFPTWAESSSRRMLAQLHDQIGRPGIAAGATVPVLTAAIDQHAAAVRDILAVGVEGSATGAVLLAGYARGLLDQAREQGWRLRLPQEPAAWARADWLTTRLLAVRDLARRPADIAFG
ncbi:MAG TPA: DUF6401 family natural product biosynthesis protein [Pseudonocardiaceae bacterium]|nr:DUF6401 family natural product biosynthesis protein [Pseudonocardiaceae bacterium]